MVDKENSADKKGSEPSAQNRLRFEALDLEATEAVVRIIKAAARLAEQNPDLFFGATPAQREILSSAAELSPESVSGTELDQLAALLEAGGGGLPQILKELIDLLKAEKDYWKPPPTEQPPFPPEGPPSIPEEPPFFPEPPGTTQCRVISFRVPTRRTGCRIELSAPGRVNVTEGFAMEADFLDGPDGSSCRCCEYRQYVSGEFTIDGDPVTHLLPDPEDPVDGTPLPMNGFPAFAEDGLIDDDPDSNVFYGHRDEGTGDHSDLYLPDRATGCHYLGTDQPGWYDVPIDSSCSINVTFLGVIIDVCNDNALRAANVWTVRCSKP